MERQRTGLSRNKDLAIEKANIGAEESDLESALMDHLQEFMLELGDGFCFEARQKRIVETTLQ